MRKAILAGPGSAEKLRRVLLEKIEPHLVNGDELGMQMCIYLQGRRWLDLAVGWTDASRTDRVTTSTLFPVFSVTKGLVSTLVHRAIARGDMHADMRLMELWPKFARNGKQEITLAHALNHTAGLAPLPDAIDGDTLFDRAFSCEALVAATCEHTPGEIRRYHPLTFGWLTAEPLRRATGCDVAKLLASEIIGPLGIESELAMPLPISGHAPVATLDQSQKNPLATAPSTNDACPARLGPLHKLMNQPRARRSAHPAFGAIATAHAIARHQAALLPGGVDGVALLTPERVRDACAPRAPERTENDFPERIALGYMVGGPGTAFGEDPWCFGHTGYGGAIALSDPARGMAIGFTKNRFNTLGLQAELLNIVRLFVDALPPPSS